MKVIYKDERGRTVVDLGGVFLILLLGAVTLGLSVRVFRFLAGIS